MKATNTNYDFKNSRDRLNNILNASNSSFEELKEIPSREKLTFTNGFYVKCTALFVDIRKSSELPKEHTKPVLAKIYRAYISELVSLINSLESCREINIHGDSVWGVFNTPYKKDISEVFFLSAKISSLIDVLNHKLEKKNFKTISVGIGIDYGRALMIKSGYNGSGINDVVWMGDVVNKASKLCGYGNKTLLDGELMVSSVVYFNLLKKEQDFFALNSVRDCYDCSVVNITMNNWLKDNS